MIEPKPLLVQASVRVQKVFNKRYLEIVKKLEVVLNYEKNPAFSITSLYIILKFIEREFDQLDEELQQKISDEVEFAYYLGFAVCLMSYYDSVGIDYTFEAVMKEVPTIIDKTTLVSVKDITMKDLLQITKNTEYTTKRYIQDVMTKHLTVDHMLSTDRKDLADVLLKELTGKKLQQNIQKNMVAIIDKAGRQWKVEDYIDMVIQTKAHQVYVQGLKDFVGKNDGQGDLARIPHNPLTTDDCKQFEGMIISMTGQTAGYRTYDDLKSTGRIFHPRCRHFPVPFSK